MSFFWGSGGLWLPPPFDSKCPGQVNGPDCLLLPLRGNSPCCPCTKVLTAGQTACTARKGRWAALLLRVPELKISVLTVRFPRPRRFGHCGRNACGIRPPRFIIFKEPAIFQRIFLGELRMWGDPGPGLCQKPERRSSRCAAPVRTTSDIPCMEAFCAVRRIWSSLRRASCLFCLHSASGRADHTKLHTRAMAISV